MVTRVLAKTTKVKNNFINGKKKFKRILSCFFWWKGKSSSYEFAFEDFMFWANSVGTILEFTAFGSGPEVIPSRASAFWFFLYTNMVFEAVRIYFPKKITRVYRNTVTCVTCVTSNRVEVRRLNSQHLAMVQTSNMAELVLSGIFCLQP